LVSLLVLVAVGSPLIFVVIEAVNAGWAPARALLHRPIAGQLIWHTLALTSLVTVITLVLGFAAAFLVERTDVPLRKLLRVALVLPLAVPEFVQGFAWVSLSNNVRGYWGAVLVMSCGLYPLVYLPVAASLRRTDPAIEEVARSLGHGQWSVLRRVTLPLNRAALGGGALLVCLYLLGEYGAFAALRFQTFATAIFNEYHVSYDTASASVLTLLLCSLALIVVVGESRVGRHASPSRANADGRVAPILHLGWGKLPACLGLLALLILSLGVPLAALANWFIRGKSSSLPATSILSDTQATLTYAVVAAVIATVAAVPLALFSWRRRTRLARAAEQGAYLTRALPGIAVGLSVVYMTIHYAQPFYEKAPMLVAGYVVLFFPLALTGVRTALATVPRGIEEVARSLGVRPWRVLLRVTFPLMGPGLGVAAALVTLSASTELTATLLLRPIGTQTLATRFWSYTTGLSYGAAAPYAAVMIAVSVIPVLILARRGAGS
jgi:iron(III) transport system permease protein